MRKYLCFLCLACAVHAGPADVKAKIQALDNPKACLAAYQNETDAMVRRTAFRKLAFARDVDRELLIKGIKDKDAKIRATAAYELFRRDGEDALPILRGMLKDPSSEVGVVLADIGRCIKDKKAASEFLAELIASNSSPQARKVAARGIGFPFYRENIPLSQNPAHDHEVTVLKTIELPITGWLFHTDPGNIGHMDSSRWFAPELKENADWKKIRVDKCWEEQGFSGYDGIAWYRIKFNMPEKIEGEALEISFGAVDEGAWVWLNGKFVGQHDVGPDGWDDPFKMDITKEIKWGAENVLAVRVEDSEMAGGIWKPVVLEVVK